MKKREKASDVFAQSTPFVGKKSSFAGAFPEIEEALAEVEESDSGQTIELISRVRKAHIERVRQLL